MASPRVLDEYSYVLGMVAAFCECIAADCKPSAFSAPISPSLRYEFAEPVSKLARENGVKLYYEESAELPKKGRLCWWVLYKRDEVLEEYLELRSQGLNPIHGLRPFRGILGYDSAQKK